MGYGDYVAHALGYVAVTTGTQVGLGRLVGLNAPDFAIGGCGVVEEPGHGCV